MRIVLAVAALVCLVGSSILAAEKAPTTDPIRIAAPELSKLDGSLADGGLPPVVGVQNIQIFRASRDLPELTDQKGWTYNHHMDMACWKGRLYVAWTNGEKDEDIWPAHEVYSTSEDGETWSPPAELFPQGVSTSLRMYFFHAPNGRMLAIAGLRFSQEKLEEQTKRGLVVREIRKDHSLGDVFTLIADPRRQASPPLYQTSSDKEFVHACEQLLANHPFLETQDGGVLLGNKRMRWNIPDLDDGTLKNFGKAISFYHRKDNALVGIAKQGWTIVSTDEGENWSRPVRPGSIVTNNAKVWGQRLSDGRFALLYNPQNEDRFPLAMVTGDDGVTFTDMRIVHGEVPRQRYAGEHKNIGAQYVRGISEWATDGSRKDAALWVVYSMNKEDIWVSRIPVPAQASGWSTYRPKWASVTQKDNSLQLENRDPCDYAKATYTFPDSPRVSVKFHIVKSEFDRGTLKLEFVSEFAGPTPVRFSLPNVSLSIQIDLDAAAGTSTMFVDGVSQGANPLPGPIQSFQRLSFQTGDWRSVGKCDPVPPGSDKPAEPIKFIIRDFEVR